MQSVSPRKRKTSGRLAPRMLKMTRTKTKHHKTPHKDQRCKKRHQILAKKRLHHEAVPWQPGACSLLHPRLEDFGWQTSYATRFGISNNKLSSIEFWCVFFGARKVENKARRRQLLSISILVPHTASRIASSTKLNSGQLPGAPTHAISPSSSLGALSQGNNHHGCRFPEFPAEFRGSLQSEKESMEHLRPMQ